MLKKEKTGLDVYVPCHKSLGSGSFLEILIRNVTTDSKIQSWQNYSRC